MKKNRLFKLTSKQKPKSVSPNEREEIPVNVVEEEDSNQTSI